MFGTLAGIALVAIVVCAVRHVDPAWAATFAAVFGGCAIYLGFLVTAMQQERDREERQLREANTLLRRFRTDPTLAFFIQIIDFGLLGPRKLVLPPDLAALNNGNPIFEYDPLVFTSVLVRDPKVPPAIVWIYGDALNVGLDYLTEVALLVEKGVIAYRDLGALCYFLERMRDPDFAGGALMRMLTDYKYEAVLRLLARDTSEIRR